MRWLCRAGVPAALRAAHQNETPDQGPGRRRRVGQAAAVHGRISAGTGRTGAWSMAKSRGRRGPAVALQARSPGEVLESGQPHGDSVRRTTARPVWPAWAASVTDRGPGARRRCLADHRGPFPFGRGVGGRAGQRRSAGLHRICRPSGRWRRGRFEPVPVEEPGPRAVLVRVGDAERLLGPAPGLQRLGLVAHSALSSACRAATHAAVAGEVWSETFSSASVSRTRARPFAPSALGT